MSKIVTGKKRKLRSLKDVSSDELSDEEARNTAITAVNKQKNKTEVTKVYDLWGSKTNGMSRHNAQSN